MRGWTLLALLAMGSTALAQEDSEEPVHEEESPPAETLPKRREWLAGHQSPDGGWSCNGFQAQCEGDPCPGAGTWQNETGTTGLVLLAFVGYGETHRTPRYGDVIRRASARLMEIQDEEGCYGIRYPERFLADHSIATLAMVELAALTQSPRFRPSAERAVAFLLSQRGTDGGWRTGDRFLESDAVATAWAVTALRSAGGAGIPVEEDLFLGAAGFLDGLTDPDSGEVRIHRFETEPSRLAAAAAIMACIYSRVRVPDDPANARDGLLLLREYPDGGLAVDPEFWYFGTQACFQLGGDTWKRWNEAMKKTVIDTEVMDGESCRWGSWDPVPGPSEEMGRIATTAFGVLCLETYYRYARVFGSKGPPKKEAAPPPPAARVSNRAAALDLDFPEPRTGFVR